LRELGFEERKEEGISSYEGLINSEVTENPLNGMEEMRRGLDSGTLLQHKLAVQSSY